MVQRNKRIAFVEWACGNRTYLSEGREMPAECPHEECGETNGSIYYEE